MKADLIFDNVRVYDVEKADVLLGQTFTVELSETSGDVRWFSDKDKVLIVDETEDGMRAVVQATAKGVSEIQLQVAGRLVMKLDISVYDQIAVSLNPTSGSPELK